MDESRPLAQSDLWHQVLQALAPHIWREQGDTDAQSALNRIAAKVLGSTGGRSFDPSNTTVRLVSLSPQQVAALQPFRENAPKPAQDRQPIVLLETPERLVIVDGNKRVAKWQKEQLKCPRQALVLTPR
jgi:hypothetical protein